jgi:BMFP domain-containing protein YqiC
MNTNDEQDRIKELEHIIRTMNQEMTYIQSINDTYEELISNAQEVLLEARNEYNISNEILKKTQKENEKLRRRIVYLNIELAKKENDYDDINTELCEEKRILSFIEEQTNEMRNMINNASNNKKGKLTIEELI